MEVEVAEDLHLDPERGELRLLQLVVHSLDRHLCRGARVQESPKILIRFLNRLWFVVNLAKEQISIVVKLVDICQGNSISTVVSQKQNNFQIRPRPNETLCMYSWETAVAPATLPSHCFIASPRVHFMYLCNLCHLALPLLRMYRIRRRLGYTYLCNLGLRREL